MILVMVGAIIITFRKAIAAGTSSPGIASLSTPIIGAAMVFFGLFEGLFGGGHIFLGIITSLIALIILASPIIFVFVREKRGKK
jgi:hypothetical protein